MKTYPSIPKNPIDVPIYAFDKLDGSNIRAEWTSKKKFWKFGTRNRLLSDDEHPFGEAISLVQEKYEKNLSDIFKNLRYQKVICFFEFFGPNSEFGIHQEEEHDVVLFDVNPFKKGMTPPKDFLKNYGELHIPNMVYYGNPNEVLVQKVKEGSLEGVMFEGVVCKGVRSNQVVMFKIKSEAWLQRLREYCHGDEALFKRMQ